MSLRRTALHGLVEIESEVHRDDRGFFLESYNRRRYKEVASGLRRTVDWYRDNEAWWKRRRAKEFWEFYERNYRGLPSRAIPQ